MIVIQEEYLKFIEDTADLNAINSRLTSYVSQYITGQKRLKDVLKMHDLTKEKYTETNYRILIRLSLTMGIIKTDQDILFNIISKYKQSLTLFNEILNTDQIDNSIYNMHRFVKLYIDTHYFGSLRLYKLINKIKKRA